MEAGEAQTTSSLKSLNTATETLQTAQTERDTKLQETVDGINNKLSEYNEKVTEMMSKVDETSTKAQKIKETLDDRKTLNDTFQFRGQDPHVPLDSKVAETVVAPIDPVKMELWRKNAGLPPAQK
jgi:DNA repair ATPase RecN